MGDVMRISDLIVLKCAKKLKKYCAMRDCRGCIFNRNKSDGESYYCEFDILVPEDWDIK